MSGLTFCGKIPSSPPYYSLTPPNKLKKSINSALDRYIFQPTYSSVSIGRNISMIKIAAVFLFVISLASAIRNPTRHIIHQEVFLKRSVESRQSSCDSIIAECSARIISLADQYDIDTTEGLARYLSAVAVIQCESCFDDFERFYMCTGDDELAEQLREASCARSDNDGKYCEESLFDGIANEDLPSCDEEDDVCTATCQDLRTLRNYWGCCTSSFEEYGLLANTTQEYDDCDATLGEPCSGVFATPAFLVIAVLALITSSFF